MSLDPFADLFAQRWPRSLPRVSYQPPALESLSYLCRRLQRATREADLPELDLRQQRILSLRRGPKLRERLTACLGQLLRQPAADLWANAAAPALREILERDEELARLKNEAHALSRQVEDALLLLSIEVGVLSERVLAQGALLPKGDALAGLRRAQELKKAIGLPQSPALPRAVSIASPRPRSAAAPWKGPLERCLEVPLSLLAVLPIRLAKVRRRLAGPVLKPAQREGLLKRGPHGREAIAEALILALQEAPELAERSGVDADYLANLLARQVQLRALRRGALGLAGRAEGAQLLLGAYGRCIYEMLIELLQGRAQNPRLQPSERRRLGAEFAPILRLARLGDERLPGEAELTA